VRLTCAPPKLRLASWPAVLAREGHALRDALVDDRRADLREAVDVGLARAEVAALDRVVEQPPDGIAVVRVVLGRVDAALRGDAVRAARAVLEAEGVDVVAELGQARGRRAAGQPGADDDDPELALVGRVDQLHLEAVAVPLLLHRPAGHLALQVHGVTPGGRRMMPASTAAGMAM
jgi:hypothetical protein